MIEQLERQKSQATISFLPQRDDCTTRKTRKVKQPALLFPSEMIAQLERQENSNDQLFSSSAG